MLSRISALSLALVFACSFALAEDKDAPNPKADKKSDNKQAAAAAGAQEPSLKKDKVRVLRPRDVAAELKKLETKADIKAELQVRTTKGRPIVFKGVVRSGKLIERIVKRRFVPQKTVEHPDCGVRIWWAGDTDGFIFFRYATIKTLTLTGRLTEKERREIMRRLALKRAGKDEGKGKSGPAKADELAKMTAEELKAYMVEHYSYVKGWNHKRMRDLKRRKLIKNEVLSPKEEIFVKYFSVLVEAHFDSLKKQKKQIEIEHAEKAAEKEKPAGRRGDKDEGESKKAD